VTVLAALGGRDVTGEVRATFAEFVVARGQALQRTAFARHRVVIPCDDTEHVVSGPPLLAHDQLLSEDAATNPHTIEISASDEIAWRVVVLAD